MEKSKYQTHAEVLIKLSNQLDLTGKGLEAALATITETVASTLTVDQVSIWQLNSQNMEARCLNLFSNSGVQKPTKPISLITHEGYLLALQTEQAIACTDVTTDRRVATMPSAFWVDPKIKSYLHIPVRMTNEVAGILRIDSHSEGSWMEENIHFCVHVAGLVSQVLLSNELMLRTKNSMKLRSLATDLTYRFELPTLLTELVHRCVDLLDCTHGTLFLADPERRMVVSAAEYNVPSKQPNRVFRYGEHVAGKVAETGQGLLIKDYRIWPGRTEDLKKDELLTTILSLPLLFRSEVIGVLQMTRRDSDRSFVEQDRETLTEFANLACLAIEQNRLVETNLHLNRFQDALKQIIKITSFSSSVTDFLETTIDYVLHAVSAQMAVIYIGEVFSYRGLAAETHRQIEKELLTRGKRFNPITVVHDLNISDAGYPDLAEIMRPMNVRAYILAPIPMNHERVGYVCIASKLPRTWTGDEIKMTEIVGTQVGLAVEGIRFFQESQSQTEILKRVTNVTTSINRLVSMDDLMPMIGDGAMRLFNTDRLAVVLREQSKKVHVPWVFGLPKPEFSQIISEVGNDLLDMISTDVEPQLVTNITKSSLPQKVKNFLVSMGIKMLKLAPITYSGNVIGLLVGFHQIPVVWLPHDRQMIMTYTNTVALALQNTWSYEQLEKGYLDLAVSLAEAMESRESQVKAASVRLADWALRTAQLIGLSRDEQDIIRWAALLHDIGKVEVPDDIIQKHGPLTRDETQNLHRYPIISEKLVRPLSSYREIGAILRGIREHYDGSGYPDKREGNDIPLAARILAVADAYSSMIDDRPYRSARTHAEAVNEITKNSGKQFDPQVVDAFMKAVLNQQQFVN